MAKFQINLVLLSFISAILIGGNPAYAQEEQTVDFERHVAPVFGRLGCNSAACHGAFGGKSGFQLSLFGYSPKMDFRNLDDRIDNEDPKLSLLLQKPTGMEEHEGGVLFDVDSGTYRTIQRWIEQGAKWKSGSGRVKTLVVKPIKIEFEDFDTSENIAPQTLSIIADFTDGTSENVTGLCRFTSRDEGVATVSPDGEVVALRNGDTSIIVSYGNAFATATVLAPFAGDQKALLPEAKNAIDMHVNEKLSQLNIAPSAESSDEEFLRRVTIDAIGTIPTPGEVTSFCDDTDPDKRERKIDELLAHPMHAALWATRMCDITKCDVNSMGEDELLAARRAQMWHDWFRKRFAENISYAEIARGVITATSREGASVGDWMRDEESLIHQARESFESDYADRESLDLYWRRISQDGENQLKQTAELTAAAFTGVRLNCAQCHKHPFDRWTQNDYAAFANIFSRVVYGSSTEVNVAILDELQRRREAKKNGETARVLPRIREVYVSEELARGINGSEPGVDVDPRAYDSDRFDTSGDLRQQFFDWLVEEDNPYFARSFVNRVWAVYFGIGIVDPVDDFSVTNPPSHPELLDELAKSFRESEFDIRALQKQILMSAAYQRTSTPNEFNLSDRRNFARQYIRPMLAEVALDSINKTVGTSQNFGENAPSGSLAIEIGSNQIAGDAGRALKMFGRGKRESVCDCDRRSETDLRQFIYTVNDQSIFDKIRRGSIRELLALENDDLIQRLYLRTLGRVPDESEIEVANQHFAAAGNREVAFDDLVWAILNTREFITIH